MVPYISRYRTVLVHHTRTDFVSCLYRYATEIQSIGRHDEHSKLSELAAWSGPLGSPGLENVSARGIPALVETVKKSLESGAPAPTPEIITCVRILKHLAVPPKRYVWWVWHLICQYSGGCGI